MKNKTYTTDSIFKAKYKNCSYKLWIVELTIV